MRQPWDPFLDKLREEWSKKNPDGYLPFAVQRRTVSILAHLITFSRTGLHNKPVEGWHEMFDEVILEAAHHLGCKPLDLWYKVVSLRILPALERICGAITGVEEPEKP